jgi:hypothetical protein
LACRFAVRAGALSVAVLLGGGLAVGAAHADPVPTTTTVAPTTTTNSTPPPTETSEPPPSTTFPPPPTTTTTPTGPGEGDLADLRVTAALDKRLYRPNELVRLTVTITNAGPVAASGVHGFGTGDLDVGDTWGELASDPGVTIDPGATRVVELSGHVTPAASHFFQFNGYVFPAGFSDANPDDNYFAVSGDIVGETGTFGGTIFTDLNRNRVVDPGESGLSGVIVRITGGDPFGQYERTTDPSGRFSFTDVPTGRYSVSYGNTGGWVVGFIDVIDLNTSDLNADVLIPATRSLSESLGVQARFDQDVYRAGDTVHLTVILTSRAGDALTGITARCNAAPDSPVLRGGPGWGPLDPAGPGVSLAAGQSAVVPVSEPLPDAAPRFGYVQVFCELHAAGYPAGNVVFLSANARVIGPPGRGIGKVYEDRDGDFSFDEGEQVAGVTVLLKDQDTGAAVASPVTDEHGEFTVDGLPSTTYDLRVTGPWKPRFDCCDEFHFFVNATDFVFPQTFVVLADPGQGYHKPNIKVSAAFDRPAYNSGDDVHARITVTNIGDAAAEGVRALQDCCGTGTLQVDFDAWGELSFFSGPGAHVDPGQTRVFDILGYIRDADASAVTFGVSLSTGNGDGNSGNNRAFLLAPVTRTFGNYAGVVFGDRNDNGRLDRGEELPNVRIFFGGRFGNSYEQLTDAQGRFAFNQVPTGRYSASFTPPDGWVGPYLDNVRVDETDDPPALIRAVRPLSDTLHAKMTFRENRYDHVGEPAHLTVTLRNTGRKPVEHIFAWCNQIGNSNQINGFGPGWGQLSSDTGGVTIRPGETRTFEVTEPVPSGAPDFGLVIAGCGFTANFLDGPPFARDSVNFAGLTGHAHGRLVQDVNGDGNYDEPVANTRVGLLVRNSHCPVAFAVTDADGNFDIPDLLADEYDFHVFGPWRPIDGEFMTATVYSGFDPGQSYYRLRRIGSH